MLNYYINIAMTKIIKIIYDKYENDTGFSYLPDNQINNIYILLITNIK